MRTVLPHAFAALLLLAPLCADAQTQPYAGQQARAIASLSQADIAALEAGQGWGLAKPAELNGYPGPAHVLELADALALDAGQRAQVQDIFEAMTGAAQAAGQSYIEAEAHLSMMFRSGHATSDRLDAQLSSSADALARLRAVHLHAHLETTALLTDAQRAAYSSLRGYADGTNNHGDNHGNHTNGADSGHSHN